MRLQLYQIHCCAAPLFTYWLLLITKPADLAIFRIAKSLNVSSFTMFIQLQYFTLVLFTAFHNYCSSGIVPTFYDINDLTYVILHCHTVSVSCS